MDEPITLDECLERLHATLHRGERPVSAGELPAEAARLPVLLELVHAEIDFRLKQREPCRVEEYFERYPGLCDDPDGAVGLILAEAKFRNRFEPALCCDEYYDRFPEYRAALEARLVAELGSAGRFPQVPGYAILAELGRGGMGVVYKARQAALGRLVALKLVLDGGALGSEEASRLRVEAQAIAALEHPNVVRLYEVGAHAGCSYLRWSTWRASIWRRIARAGPCRHVRLPRWSRRWPAPWSTRMATALFTAISSRRTSF